MDNLEEENTKIQPEKSIELGESMESINSETDSVELHVDLNK